MKHIIILDITIMSCYTHKSKAREYAEAKLKELGFKDLSQKDWGSNEDTLFEVKKERGPRLFIEVWHSVKHQGDTVSAFTRAKVLNRISYLFKNDKEEEEAEVAIFVVQMRDFEPIGYSFITEK